jgi:hypothetical protein
VADVMLLKIFSQKNVKKFGEMGVFISKLKCLRIAESRDHNIDPRLAEISPFGRYFLLLGMLISPIFWAHLKYRPKFTLIYVYVHTYKLLILPLFVANFPIFNLIFSWIKNTYLERLRFGQFWAQFFSRNFWSHCLDVRVNIG